MRPTEKPHTREAMERAGLSGEDLAAAARMDRYYVWRALNQKLDADRAGRLVRTLAAHTDLGHRQRREIFHELVDNPGQRRPLAWLISSEHSQQELYDAYPTYHSNPALLRQLEEDFYKSEKKYGKGD